jgi:hypothetical protein
MLEWKAQYVDNTNDDKLAEELEIYVREQAA